MTPKQKITAVLKEALTTDVIECVETDDFLYAQVKGRLDTLIAIKPTFLRTHLNLLAFYTQDLFKNGQADYTKALKVECTHCNPTTGLWSINYADTLGMHAMSDVIKFMLEQASAPMGPFIPIKMEGWDRCSEERKLQLVKQVGIHPEEEIGDRYRYCTFPQKWTKRYGDKIRHGISVNVLDENGAVRAVIENGDATYNTRICFRRRYQIHETKHGKTIDNTAFAEEVEIRDFAFPHPDLPYKIVKTFNRRDVSEPSSAAHRWLCSHNSYWEDPIESWLD